MSMNIRKHRRIRDFCLSMRCTIVYEMSQDVRKSVDWKAVGQGQSQRGNYGYLLGIT